RAGGRIGAPAGVKRQRLGMKLPVAHDLSVPDGLCGLFPSLPTLGAECCGQACETNGWREPVPARAPDRGSTMRLLARGVEAEHSNLRRFTGISFLFRGMAAG